MKKHALTSKLIRLGVLVALLALVPILPSSAQGMGAQPNEVLVSVPLQEGPTDPQELEAFLDEFFAEQMEESDIPGAVFVLVKDGEIFFTKGYGYADLESQRPVVPDETVFLPGSVGKLFTAVAVMQLVEQGKMDLDDDINEYLDDFQLPDTYPEPVTVGDLLTHTGGFDERFIGAAVSSPEELLPLGEYLAQNTPPRVMPAGDNISYCNHCYALAGYLVEKVAGIPWAQYVDENILQPLDMRHSTCQQPPPPDLASDLAVGYVYVNGEYKPMPDVYMNIAPAGALYATANDMAHFMIAHLHNGRYGDFRILQEDTAREMHRRGFSNHPQLPGYTYGGFSEFTANGQPVLVKGGDVGGFSSLLVLLPEQNVGFFASLNAALNLFAGEEPREELLGQFLDQYYPVQEQPISPLASPDLRRVSGSYRWNRYSRTTMEKALNPIGMLQSYVIANDDDTLTVKSVVPLVKAARYTEVEPLLFRQVDGTSCIAFREDEGGRITQMFGTLGEEPATFEKVPWYETDRFQLNLIVFLVLAFLSVLAWPVMYLIRRFRRRLAQDPRRARVARRLAAVLSILNLVFMVGFAAALIQGLTGALPYPPPWFAALLVIPIFTTVLSTVLLVFAALAWKDRYWSVVGRLHYSLVVMAALVFVWFANYWNLLGFRF
jgi:CubicO group peptidase (beta-lactamase class C family)